ncbi:MAG: DMT family transporter [Alphaproteobacteria bacterium]|jgi:drug/metabolite transporter (DMT)-like permease|nr:DMT family transporter [Alphaproteobacteria bacterium]
MTETNRGLLLGVGGIALVCAMDAVAKALGAELSTFQVVFARYCGAALWLALWIALTGESWPRFADLGRHALRAAMLVATATMFFYAVTNLPLAVVAALGMAAPLYVVLIGAVFLRERVAPASFLALALGMAGSAVIVLGNSGRMDLGVGGSWLAWTAAIMAPVSYAATLAVLKQHSGTETAAAMTLGQSAIASVLVLPLALTTPIVITAPVAGLSALIGFLGAAGFLLLINGLRRMPVSAFAVIDYTGLLWAALFGLVFFGELPGLPFLLGAALIIAGCTAMAMTQRQQTLARVD